MSGVLWQASQTDGCGEVDIIACALSKGRSAPGNNVLLAVPFCRCPPACLPALPINILQAAGLFRRELATKSDEVSALQGQLRAMRHELTTSNAYSAAAVAEAGAARAAAALQAAAAAGRSSACHQQPVSPSMACSPPGPGHGALGVGVIAGGFQSNSMRCCSPTVAAATGPALNPGRHYVVQGFNLDASPGPCCCSSESPTAGAAAAAAAVVATELQALRASRANHQSVLLQQAAVRNSLLGSLGDALQVRLAKPQCVWERECVHTHVQQSL